ncbi:MAG: T9SS type A sorting domain-containing protein [bacterium]
MMKNIKHYFTLACCVLFLLAAATTGLPQGGGVFGTMSGPRVGFFFQSSTGQFAHTTTTNLVSGTAYALSFAIGHRDGGQNVPFAGYQIDLLSGGTVIASTSSATSPAAPGTFGDVTLNHTATATDPVGPLGIRIGVLNSGHLDFDNVRFTADNVPIAVTNHDFESPALGDGGINTGSIPGWVETGNGINGTFNPSGDTWYLTTLDHDNRPPDCSNASIGDQTVGPSGQATLSGGDVTGIPDPDGDPLTITVSPSTLRPGVHTVTVTADDGNGGTCSKDVTVRVFPALPHGLMLLANKDIQIDSPALSEGDLHSYDDIRIKKDNTIDGDVTAGDDLQVEPGATVTGTQTENGSVARIPLPSLAFTTGGDNVRVPKNGSRDLSPGAYGEVKVRRGGTLNLENDGSSGEYFFERLRLDKGATLAIDANEGEVTINVKDDIVFSANSEVTIDGPAAGIESRFVTVNCTDDMRIDQGARVLGNLIAPRHHVFLKKEAVFKGAICARNIQVEEGVTLLHYGSTTALPKRVLLADEAAADESAEFAAMPTDFALEQNYPNPFNPSTTVVFSLPQAGKVSLKIYNLQGQLVATLYDGALAGGRHQMVWNGKDARGLPVASGIYVYRLETAEFVATKKLTLMK